MISMKDPKGLRKRNSQKGTSTSTSFVTARPAATCIRTSLGPSGRRIGSYTECDSRFALSRGLDERDFVDLFERGDAGSHLVQGRFAQKSHAFFPGRATDL